MAERAPPPSTVTMVDEAGASVAIPSAEARDAYLSGKFAFVPGTPVPVERGGQIEVVPAEEAAKRFETSFTTKGSTFEGARKQRQEERFSGVLPTLAATGIGAAKGLTLGAAPALASAAADVFGGPGAGEATREYLRGSEEEHPYAQGLGELVGIAAPALVTGGGSLAARGGVAGAGRLGARALGREAVALAGAPTRLVGELGGAAGGLAERGVVALGAREGGAVANMAGMAARGAAETPFYSIGNAISDATIHDQQITAEQLFAAGAGGMLGGAVFGAGLGGLGELASGAIAGTGKLAAKAAGRDAALAAHLSERGVVGTMADELAVRSLGGGKVAAREFRALPAEIRAEVPRVILEDVPRVNGKALMASSKEEIAAGLVKLDKEASAEIGTHLRELDKAKAGKPDVAEIKQRAFTEVLDPLMKTPFAEKEARAIQRELQSFAKKTMDPTFEELHAMRQRLDKSINWRLVAENDPKEGAKAAFRRIIEEQILKDGQSTAEKMGAEFAARYTRAKERFRAVRWAKDAAEEGAVREAGNRIFGATELVSGAAGGAAALAGGGIGALALPVLAHYGRTRGAQVAADLANRAVSSDMIRSITEAFSTKAGNAINAYVGAPKMNMLPKGGLYSEAMRAATKPSRESEKAEAAEFDRRRSAIASWTPQRSETATAGLASQPDVRLSVMATADRAMSFLGSKLPPAPQSMDPLQSRFEKPRDPSPEQIAKFNRYFRAVEDPVSVLDDLAAGRITTEGVEALRAVYPKTYALLQHHVMEQVSEAPRKLTYQQQLQIGYLLGVPATPLAEPRIMALVQQVYGPGQTGAASPMPAAKPSRSHAGKSLESPSQSVINGGELPMGTASTDLSDTVTPPREGQVFVVQVTAAGADIDLIDVANVPVGIVGDDMRRYWHGCFVTLQAEGQDVYWVLADAPGGAAIDPAATGGAPGTGTFTRTCARIVNGTATSELFPAMQRIDPNVPVPGTDRYRYLKAVTRAGTAQLRMWVSSPRRVPMTEET